MTKAELLNQRMTRIKKAVALEKPDRIPVVLPYALFAPRTAGISFNDFCSSIAGSAEAMIQTYYACGDADGMDYTGFATYGLSMFWLSKVKVPGQKLPEDVPYRISEAELVKVQDYDTILNRGWPEFYKEFLGRRVFHDVAPEVLPFNKPYLDAKTVCDPLGIPVLAAGAPLSSPFELLCDGRSMTKFIHDLFTMPDKVQAVMNEISPYVYGPFLDISVACGYTGIRVGGWGAADRMLSPKLWDRFVWPYFRKMVQDVVDRGLVAILHLDSDWACDLARFRELPGGRCILGTGGHTDLFKAKELLGDHMCLMADVPTAMFSMSSPDAVYDYCTKLVGELGPEGFILHSGCDIPDDAKLENVRAMVAAAAGN